MNLPSERPLAVVNCGELVTLSGPQRPRIRDEMKELSILRNAAMLVRRRHNRTDGFADGNRIRPYVRL